MALVINHRQRLIDAAIVCSWLNLGRGCGVGGGAAGEELGILGRRANELVLLGQRQLWLARIELHLALGGDWGWEKREAGSKK